MTTHKSNHKEQRIIAAARKLFASYGPKKTTIDEIATEARVAKGTIYLYFKSKEDIFMRVARHEIAGLVMKLRNAARLESSATCRLKRFLRVRLSFHEDLTLRRGITSEVILEVEDFAGGQLVGQEYLFNERQIIEEILTDGVEQGEFFIADLQRTSLALSFSIQGLDLAGNRVGRGLKVEEKVDLILELILPSLTGGVGAELANRARAYQITVGLPPENSL